MRRMPPESTEPQGEPKPPSKILAVLLGLLHKLAVAIPMIGIIIWALSGGPIWTIVLIAGAAVIGTGEMIWRIYRKFNRQAISWWRLSALSAPASAAFPLVGAVFPRLYWEFLLLPLLAGISLWATLVRPSRNYTLRTTQTNPALAALEATCFIGGTLGCLVPVALSTDGVDWLVKITILTVASDSLSSVSGVVWQLVLNLLLGSGRRRRIKPPTPQVSPNKTWTGFIVGAVGTIAIGTHLGGHTELMLAVAIAIAAPLGDLFGSALKRGLGIKDWSRLLGPHGGLGDRLDSMMFSAAAGYIVLSFADVIGR